jgi:methylmalonyl-CoA mutase
VWAALLAECGVAEDGRGLRLQVRTADRMMTVRDPWVNLLRVTSAAFAGALGGADGVLALPFDSELGVPDEFGRRLARNTNLLLQEESNVGRVLDPAGGSWFVEALTEQLATVGWDLFAGIEASGGMAAVITDGSWKERIDGAAKVRHEAIAHRKVPITGVSEFPFLDEKPVERTPFALPTNGADLPDGAFAPVRDAEASYEALRNLSDTYLDAHGHRPQVFLANLGPVAVHTARSTWAKNFFEAGGIEALGNNGFTDPEAAGAAFAASGARVACICGSDAIYGELAEATAIALLAAGARRVYLAGNPGDARAGYEAAGVAEFVHVGVNVIQALAQAHGTIADEENAR